MGTRYLVGLCIVLAVSAVLLTPPSLWPDSARQLAFKTFGPPSPQEFPAGRTPAVFEAEAPCTEPEPEWRRPQDIDGVDVEGSRVCNPDNPFEIAAFVKGTNNISHSVLMKTRLSPDAIIKRDDLDKDGDPDVIEIRLEVSELNGFSPDTEDPVPGYFIAPGVQPGFWAFSPKARGMATENFEEVKAHRSLRPPSPVVRVEQGDKIKIILENTHYMPHTIHFHGVDHPFVDEHGEGNDGVPQTSEIPVMPGEARSYELKPRQSGTMFYHCHVQPAVHILMGLQGMFVVEENRPDNWVQTLNIGAGHVRHRSRAVREVYDREYDLHYQDIDNDMHTLIQGTNDPRSVIKNIHQRYDITERTPDYFLLNGKSFPYTIRESMVVVSPNERVRLRVLNGGGKGVALHTHGHKATITHTDGVLVPEGMRLRRDVVWVAPAQRVDLLLETKNDGLRSYGEGIWLFHDHQETAITNDGIGPGGGISAIVYESFLDEDGWPRLQGVDWSPYFSKAYYEGEVPVWQAYDPLNHFGDTARANSGLLRSILLAVDLGLLSTMLVILFRQWGRSQRA